MRAPDCPLCNGPGGPVVFQGAKFRLVRVQEAGFPAFYRLIWSDHVAEFSDLGLADRQLCMDAVVQVEQTLRAHLRPDKINLATLGNLVPHLHWHIVARFEWDSHFPAPVWASAQREIAADAVAAIEGLRPRMEADLAHILATGPGN
jgi:diadenosine tetraphosphate (Ap4A) HIT family hydrolase